MNVPTRSAVLRTRLAAVLGGLLALAPGLAPAEDIDIYVGTTPALSQLQVPILVILDSSASMATNIEGVPVTYNPLTAYDGDFDRNKIYWSTTGIPTNDVAGRSRNFDANKNHCASSTASLSSPGYYTADYVARWNPSNCAWVDLAVGTDTQHVDCYADYAASNPSNPNYSTDGYPRNVPGNCSNQSTPEYTTNRNNANKLNDWALLQKPGLYSGNYLNYFYNPPAGETRTRLQVAQQAITDLVNSTSSFRFGLMTFNDNSDEDIDDAGRHGGRVVKGITEMDATNKADFLTALNAITPGTYTPLSETLWEAYRYFSGGPVDYGAKDPSALPARDTSVEDPYMVKYASPFNGTCQPGYVVLVSDGAADLDSNAVARIEEKIGQSCTGTGEGRCLDDLAKYMYETNVYPDSGTVTRVTTYGIGVGEVGQLQEAAAAGHGKYFPVTTASGLTTAFQSVVSDINLDNTTFAAPSLVYFALFRPENTTRWNGNVKKYTLNSEGTIVDQNNQPIIDPLTSRIKKDARSFWSTVNDGGDVKLGGSGSKVPAAASRLIYTYTGSTAPDNVALNVDAHKLTVANTALTLAMLGITSTGDATQDAANRAARINWIRGIDTQDEDVDQSRTDERWKHGDPLHSRPLAVTFGGTEANPVIKLFVGLNDGSIRMFNEGSGVEEWAFYPRDMLTPLQGILESNPGGSHPYGVDGTPVVWTRDRSRDAANNIVDIANGVINPADGDFVKLFIGERRGGNNLFALNVTPDGNGAIYPTYMWKITGGAGSYVKLGQTWSRPIVTKIRVKDTGPSAGTGDSAAKTVLIFGGGYHSAQDSAWGPSDGDGTGIGTGNAIYIVDPDTGARIWWASRPGSGATLELPGMNYPIPSQIIPIDSNGDGETDRLYVGDLGGQVWRIDLGELLTTNQNGGTTGARLATLADSSTAAGKRKFFYPPDVALVRDTAYSSIENYDLITIASGDRVHPVDTAVQDHVYAIRDYLIHDPIALDNNNAPVNYTALTLSNLMDVTSNNAPAADDLKAKYGWYIQLKESSSWIGEKSLASTIILDGTLFFTTYIPTTALSTGCVPSEGYGRFYAVRLLTGSAKIDFDKSTTYTTADRFMKLGGGIPSELVPVIQESGVTGLVGVGGGAAQIGQGEGLGLKLPRVPTYWKQK